MWSISRISCWRYKSFPLTAITRIIAVNIINQTGMTMADMRHPPLACFDSIAFIDHCSPAADLTAEQCNDFAVARAFLTNYVSSVGTFNSYRREVERLLQWTWHIAFKTLDTLKRDDIENFLRFCQRPPAAWIGLKIPPRFLNVEGQRRPNPAWRPYRNPPSGKVSNRPKKRTRCPTAP